MCVNNNRMQHTTGKSIELLRETAVAEILTLSVWTLSAWRRKGTGPRWMRLGPKRIVYAARDLAVYLRDLPGGGAAAKPGAP